jgi:hypothetical protein
MVNVHNGPVRSFRNLGYEHTRVVLEVHDALLLQYHESVEDAFLSDALAAMTIPFEIDGREIVIPVGAESGYNWGHRDPTSNPNGLEKYAFKRTG